MGTLVILVNADERVLQPTGAILSGAGHVVAPVSSYDEARELLDLVVPDFLVADVQLGTHNGLHLAIRSHFDHPDVPVIVTHTRPDPIAEMEARRHGADFVVAAVDNPTELLRRVEVAVATRHLEA